MKKPVTKTIFIILLLTLTILSSCAGEDVYSGTPGVSAIKGTGEFISEGLTTLAEIMWPLPLQPNREVNFLAVLITFIIVFSLIYASSKKLKVFDESSGPRKAFAIAVSLLVTFFSPLAYYMTTFVLGTFGVLVSYGLAFFAIVIFWWITRAGGSAIGDTNTNFRRDKANRGKIDADTSQEDARLRNVDTIERREEAAINNLENLTNKEMHQIDDLLNYWLKIKEDMAKIDSIITTPEGVRLRNQLLSEIAGLLNMESAEEAVNEQIKNVEKVILKTDYKELKNLKFDDKLAKDIMARDPSLNGQDVDKMIRLAEHYLKQAEAFEKKTKRLTNEEAKFESQVKKGTKKVADNLKTSPPRIRAAQQEIDLIIDEIEKERTLVADLVKLENSVMEDHRGALKEIQKALSKEIVVKTTEKKKKKKTPS